MILPTSFLTEIYDYVTLY